MLQVSKVSKKSKLQHHVAKAGRWLCEAREVWAMEILWIKLAKPIKFVEYCFCLQLLVSKQIWKGSFKTLQPMRPQHFLESLPGALKNGTVHLCFSPSLYPCAFCFPPSRSPHEGDSASLLRWELSAVSKPLSQKRHLKLSFKKRCKKKLFGEDNRWGQVLSDVCQSSLQRALRRRLEPTEIAESKHPRLRI